ncbi:MAG: hypothetical protein OHK93_005951 [Ramalina farinacea]|uniref:Uncharacterized protein n=1 Tax=Ramalina farinacea TaxID=258253 RepID=A0AA43TPL8_9LECA|nr:hypothetical protein [Ramalina farinacea]
MYDLTTKLRISLLSALLWCGHRDAAAEVILSLSTSAVTTINGQASTITVAAASSMSVIVDQYGMLLTETLAELQESFSICASWLDPLGHSTIYEQCTGGEKCMLIVFLEDSPTANFYDSSSLIGCSYATLPPITTMYPYTPGSSSGCWESGFGCCGEKEPYNIVLTSANRDAVMFACATGNYGSLPVLGYEWETGTILAKETPLLTATTSSMISATSTSASSSPGSAIIPVSSTPTVPPNITQPPQGASSPSLSGRAKAGIAVGSIIGGWILMTFAAVLLWRYRKRRIEQQQPDFSFSGLENARDDGKGDNPDQRAQAAPPILSENLVSELDTKDTAEQVSGMPYIGSTELTGSSPEKTELTGSSTEKTELTGSSPTTAELTGSPIVSPANDGSESPVLPPDPTRPLSVSSGETLVSPSPPPLRLPSAVSSIPEELGMSELRS